MNLQSYIELSRAEVMERARRLWKAAGCPTGRDLEYWLRAEVELLLAKVANHSRNEASGKNPRRSRARLVCPRTPQAAWRSSSRSEWAPDHNGARLRGAGAGPAGPGRWHRQLPIES
jgi:hypothetical protein